MFFNPWRKYPKHKPKENGTYLCTVSFDDDSVKVMELRYIAWSKRWVDTRRDSVFNGYKVYKPCRATLEENRLYKDSLCDLTGGVTAWKKLSKPFID